MFSMENEIVDRNFFAIIGSWLECRVKLGSLRSMLLKLVVLKRIFGLLLSLSYCQSMQPGSSLVTLTWLDFNRSVVGAVLIREKQMLLVTLFPDVGSLISCLGVGNSQGLAERAPKLVN